MPKKKEHKHNFRKATIEEIRVCQDCKLVHMKLTYWTEREYGHQDEVEVAIQIQSEDFYTHW